MGNGRAALGCSACGLPAARWSGRCPGCGAWGSIHEVRPAGGSVRRLIDPAAPDGSDVRIPVGFAGVDRVLGGGLVPGSVILLAGEPGIGKSTLLLHLIGSLSASGLDCLLASGEESHAQVSARARRLEVAAERASFAPGRELEDVLALARAERPAILAVDSIQALRDSAGSQAPGGVTQVRACTDALVGLAKSLGIAVVMTGHVTKDGDLAGPRSLEHAVDVVLSFEGDARSGLRVLSAGKNRFGAEGETTWFEMGGAGLSAIDPLEVLVSGERAAGAAIGLPRSGRRALAVEVQALVGGSDGPARRQTTGLDARRFQLVAAVLDRSAGLPLGRCELFGASSGGLAVDDPACDLAVAASLASASTGAPTPSRSAFVGELALTGLVRPVPGMDQRLAAARASGCTTVYVPIAAAGRGPEGLRLRGVRDVRGALAWALSPAAPQRRSA